MDIDDAVQIKSSFQLIPAARYVVSDRILESFRRRRFEVNVHDLKHDGRLFEDQARFTVYAKLINEHARHFQSKGFRSGVLYRNADWVQALRFSYDMSVPNVGHLDPQPGGCCTVMPYYIGKLLELPLTTTQDYSLFNIVGTYSTSLWQEQINTIHRQHGLMSFNIHPDYLDCPEDLGAYKELLSTLSRYRSEANTWIPRPGELDSWWRMRTNMRLQRTDTGWRIEGVGAERARIAYACIHDDVLSYQVQ